MVQRSQQVLSRKNLGLRLYRKAWPRSTLLAALAAVDYKSIGAIGLPAHLGRQILRAPSTVTDVGNAASDVSDLVQAVDVSCVTNPVVQVLCREYHGDNREQRCVGYLLLSTVDVEFPLK